MDKKINFFKEILKGKTIGRVLFNDLVEKHCDDISGKILDIAGSGEASYNRYLPKGVAILTTNYKEGNVDKVVDFNRLPLDFQDEEFDNILFFNAIYIVENRAGLLKEIRRILKSEGKLFISSPFLANEMPEPVDYCRLTYMGLEKELNEACFSDINIIRFGERFTAAASLLHDFYVFNTMRFIVYTICFLLDKTIPLKIKSSRPAPIGYFCIATKKVCQ